MPRPDRAEGIAMLDRLPPAITADDRWAAAALLHDAGKAEAGLGTFGRAWATARGFVGDPARVGGRAGAYLRHAEIGAEILRSARRARRSRGVGRDPPRPAPVAGRADPRAGLRRPRRGRWGRGPRPGLK